MHFRWARTLALCPVAGGRSRSAADREVPTRWSSTCATANDRFKDVSVAVSEGYAPIACASGIDGGAMGVHYVNAKLLGDDAVDITHPQAVMYEPTPDGKMALVAVEYITSKGPASLEGQLFNFTGAPNRYGLGPFYELHVWAWKAQPARRVRRHEPERHLRARAADASTELERLASVHAQHPSSDRADRQLFNEADDRQRGRCVRARCARRAQARREMTKTARSHGSLSTG